MVCFTYFLWRTYQDNKKYIDLASSGYFMELTVTEAWELVERIHSRETWGFDS
jgi:hypothetical protein